MGEQTAGGRVSVLRWIGLRRGRTFTVEVDGEVFECRSSGRATHYDWVSGPNKGYGFTVSPTEWFSLDDHREEIRGFLAQIDPATGFLED